MLTRIKNLLAPPETATPPAADRVHVAAAALLVRAAQIDGTLDAREEALLSHITKTHFGLSEAEADALIALAHTEAEEANDLFRWTHKINAHFSYDHKLQLIELLWRVVLADGRLDDYEANLLRRVAGLIYVSDRDAGTARKRAESKE